MILYKSLQGKTRGRGYIGIFNGSATASIQHLLEHVSITGYKLSNNVPLAFAGPAENEQR
jgi:hypothetical protein